MRFKTFRRKQGKMSRKRGRGGQGKPQAPASDEEMDDMEQGNSSRQSPMLARSNSEAMDAMERGPDEQEEEEAPQQQPPMLGRQNSLDYDLAERGFAPSAPPMPEENPHHAIDMPNNEMGGQKKRKTRKGRKGKKTRKGKKGGKRGKSHRR